MKPFAKRLALRTFLPALTALFVYVVVAGYLHMSGYSPGACYVIEADQTFAGACLDFDAWGWLLGRWAA